MQVYETNADKYYSTVEDSGTTVAKRSYEQTLANALQQEVTLTFLIPIHSLQFTWIMNTFSHTIQVFHCMTICVWGFFSRKRLW